MSCTAPLGAQGPAVRARSIAAAAVSARLTTEVGAIDLLGGHVVLPDGRVVLFVSAGGPVAVAVLRAEPLTGRVLVVDLAPVAVRDRERARLEVTGGLTVAGDDLAATAWAHLRGGSGADDASCPDAAAAAVPEAVALELAPEQVRLVSPAGRHDVGLAAFRDARPDPVALIEAPMLQHLARSHPGSLAVLARLEQDADDAPRTVVPLSVSAEALTLRLVGPSDHRDLVLPFARPVIDPLRVDVAIAHLVQRASALAPAPPATAP